MKLNRMVVMSSPAYEVRREQLDGRDHLVVPVVGLVEGVVHPMNAKAGPEFVPHALFGETLAAWEGKPLYEGHPLRDGKPIRGNVPELIASRGLGRVRNAKVTDDRLTMEAWLDIAQTKLKAPALLARAESGEPIEISVGVLVDTEESEGTHAGRSYANMWSAMEPDHLALLPEGILGACSRDMGCGVRACAEGAIDETPDELYVLWPKADGTDDHGRAAAAHEKAAKAHEKAAKAQRANVEGNDYQAMGASFHAEKMSLKADNATTEAIGTKAYASGSLHEQASNASDTALDHAVGAKTRADNQRNRTAALQHDNAARLHHEAANAHHMSSAAFKKIRDAQEEHPTDKTFGARFEAMVARVREELRDLWPKADGTDDHGRDTTPGTRDEHAGKPGAKGVKESKSKRDDLSSNFAASLKQAKEMSPREMAKNPARTAMVIIEGALEDPDSASELFDKASGAFNTDKHYVNAKAQERAIKDFRFALARERKRAESAAPKRWAKVQDSLEKNRGLQQWLETNSGAGAPDSTDNDAPITGDEDMKKEDLIKFLESATPCQLKALEAVVEGKEAEKPKAPTAEELRAAEEAQATALKATIKTQVDEAIRAMTFEQVLAKADGGTRDLIDEGKRVGDAKKAATIKALQATGRCDHSEEELKAMSQAGLDRLVKLAGDNVRAAIDFGGQGGPRDKQTTDDKVADAPDLTVALRAAEAARKK